MKHMLGATSGRRPGRGQRLPCSSCWMRPPIFVSLLNDDVLCLTRNDLDVPLSIWGPHLRHLYIDDIAQNLSWSIFTHLSNQSPSSHPRGSAGRFFCFKIKQRYTSQPHKSIFCASLPDQITQWGRKRTETRTVTTGTIARNIVLVAIYRVMTGIAAIKIRITIGTTTTITTIIITATTITTTATTITTTATTITTTITTRTTTIAHNIANTAKPLVTSGIAVRTKTRINNTISSRTSSRISIRISFRISTITRTRRSTPMTVIKMGSWWIPRSNSVPRNSRLCGADGAILLLIAPSAAPMLPVRLRLSAYQMSVIIFAADVGTKAIPAMSVAIPNHICNAFSVIKRVTLSRIVCAPKILKYAES